MAAYYLQLCLRYSAYFGLVLTQPLDSLRRKVTTLALFSRHSYIIILAAVIMALLCFTDVFVALRLCFGGEYARNECYGVSDDNSVYIIGSAVFAVLYFRWTRLIFATAREASENTKVAASSYV